MKNIVQRLSVWLLVAVLPLSACAPIRSKPGSMAQQSMSVYKTYLLAGHRLMNKRQLRTALEKFTQATKLDPDATEAHFLIGETLFRMGRYPEAVNAFQTVLARDAGHVGALHRLWAARLQQHWGDKQARSAIKQEIAAILAKRGDDPRFLLAAYHGYGYFWDREKQKALIMRLAPQVMNAKLKPHVASYLLEEMLQEKDPERRLQFGEIYLDQFGDQPGTRITIAALFNTIGRQLKDKEKLLAYLGRYREKFRNNRHFNFHVAYWLIEMELDLEQAIRLLKRSLEIIDNPEQLQRPRYITHSLWQQQLGGEKASYYSAMAIAYYEQGRFGAAKRALQKARRLNPVNATVHYYLAQIARIGSNTDKTIKHLRRSLEISDRWSQAKEELQKLLEARGIKDKPAAYFADQEGVVRFTDVTAAAGLANVKARRPAWGDYDNDGDEDLLLDGSRLLRNQGNGYFIDISRQAGLPVIKDISGGIWGDYDNDGWLDIFVTTKTGNRLLKNAGHGHFVDVTATALPAGPPAPSEAAAWGDIDNDGFLDVYVANYQQPAVERAICAQDTLLHNVSGKRFEDISAHAGILTDEPMCGRGVVWSDFNNDGFLDIMVSNYRLDPNFLWINSPGVALQNRGAVHQIEGDEADGAYGHTIGSVFADFDNDGDLDLFSANLAHPRYLAFSDRSMLLMNRGDPTYRFKNTFGRSGIRFEETSADPTVADVDNDGDLDLYITSIYQGRDSYLYLNDGKGRFNDTTWLSGTRAANTWGSAFADYDNDGDMDLLLASRDSVRLLRNNGNANHWLKVSVRSRRCNRFGVGSRVTLRYGNKTQIREVTAGKGTGTQDSLILTFGLGTYEGPVQLEVKHLCGNQVRLTAPKPDRTITITD